MKSSNELRSAITNGWADESRVGKKRIVSTISSGTKPPPMLATNGTPTFDRVSATNDSLAMMGSGPAVAVLYMPRMPPLVPRSNETTALLRPGVPIPAGSGSIE